MTPAQAVVNCVRQAATFQGRAPRSEYWYWQALCTVATLCIIFLGLPPAVTSLLSIVLFLPSIALCSRRLHDINMSGWWQLVPWLLLNGGLLSFGPEPAASADGAGSGGSLSLFAAGLAGLALWLAWGLRKGTAGSNRFGLDPLAPTFFVNETGETLVELHLVPVEAAAGTEVMGNTASSGDAPENRPDLLDEPLPSGAAVLLDVFPLTLNKETWTLHGRFASGARQMWRGLPIRTGRTYVLGPNGADDMPTPDLSVAPDECA